MLIFLIQTDGFKETSKNFDVFFVKVSKTKRNGRTNSIDASINNGQRTEFTLISSFVLV